MSGPVQRTANGMDERNTFLLFLLGAMRANARFRELLDRYCPAGATQPVQDADPALLAILGAVSIHLVAQRLLTLSARADEPPARPASASRLLR